MSKEIKRIVQLRPKESEGYTAITLHESKKKKKNSSFILPIEKTLKRYSKAQKEGYKCYLKKHKRSNTKKKNGWLRDWGSNTYACNLKMFRIFYKI